MSCSQIEAKPLVWVGSAKRELLALPPAARRRFGHALHCAQQGEKHDSAKVLRGFHGAGVLELIEDLEGSTYRAVYTVKFPEAVFVLHCFQKKSKQGIAMPKEDMELIRERLRTAERISGEMRREAESH